ncbi:MAG TPA: NERD domain-containing protein [Gammaproteobacteria bacterium]|nr:NERD domain-containing protein [Gammaproteobacteria bacterium]
MSGIPIETAFYVLEAISLLALLAVIFYFWKQTRKTRHQRQLRKAVESLGVKYLHDLVLPDGVEGLVFIDYLLLVSGGLVVLDTQHVEGHIFAGESMDQWSQVTNNKTYRFPNPLYANQSACQAVLWNLQHSIDTDFNPDWSITGWVVFSSAGDFPKGIPPQVSGIDKLKTNLTPLITPQATADDQLEQAWDALHTLSINTKANNK